METIIKEYLDWKGTYASRASVNYKIWLRRFVDVCGAKALSDYGVSDVVKYHHWLEARYSPYCVQFALVVVKNFFQYCRLQNRPCFSPSLIRFPRVQGKSHRALTEGEFTKIVSVIPTNEFRQLRDAVLVRLLWDTGMRVSELCDLDVSQLDEQMPRAVIKTKKTGKPRIVVWSNETHRLLMKYLPIRLELEKLHPTTALFIGWNKKRGWSLRLTTRSVERFVRYYASTAGIKEKVTPHSFRHGWAHKRRDQNAPLAFIQRGLGHSHPVSTFVYEQYNDRDFVNNAMAYLKAA